MEERVKEFTAPRIDDQDDFCDMPARLHAKLRKFRDEHRREIVHAEKAQVFQITVGLCFSSARHPRHNHKSIISLLHADTSETYARIQNLRNHNR